MFSLLYVSCAAAHFQQHEVETLAQRAARANERAGITGLLAWNGRHFIQLLEGPEGEVRQVMGRIAADPRHRDIAYLRTEERAARECPDWGMRALLSPLTGAGSATQFAASLPPAMEPDSRMLFTSFASELRPVLA